MCVVPFKWPKVVSETEDQQEAFDKLDDLVDDGKPSSAIHWAIRQHSLLSNREPICLIESMQGCSKRGHVGTKRGYVGMCNSKSLERRYPRTCLLRGPKIIHSYDTRCELIRGLHGMALHI